MKFNYRKPALSVVLWKSISRTTLNNEVPVASKFTSSDRDIDLTPYIGEQNGVRICKSTRDPAGSFSITLTDDMYYSKNGTMYGDSLYGLIEPMDYIEICMVGDAYKQSPDEIPIMMRGFVSEIQLTETMGSDGKPQRNIVVSGQDYGKILQIMQLFYMPCIPSSDAAYLTQHPLFVQYSQQGLKLNFNLTTDFFQQVIDIMVNGYIKSMGGATGYEKNDEDALPTLLTDFFAQPAKLSVDFNNDWREGTIYSLFQKFGDIGAWNEFFIEDREDAPYVVYRPNPYIDVSSLSKVGDGNDPSSIQTIQPYPSGKFPAITQVERADIINITASRSDANLANYFWVNCPAFNFVDKTSYYQSSVENDYASVYVDNYGNVSPSLYGQRKMVETTNQFEPNCTDNGAGTPAGAERDKNSITWATWIKDRRKDLISQNKDYVIFETGSIRMKGNEKIKAGTYVRYNGALYYVVSVEHDFAPFGNYFTSVQFIRGTGFINRVSQKADSTSPYLAEMAQN